MSKCSSCDGEGRTDSNKDQSERAPWSFWENLAPGQDIAVRMGWVKPMDCSECAGTGTGKLCDTGTRTNPCKGCPDCQGIPAPRHCLEESWTGSQCILNAEHAGPHK